DAHLAAVGDCGQHAALGPRERAELAAEEGVPALQAPRDGPDCGWIVHTPPHCLTALINNGSLPHREETVASPSGRHTRPAHRAHKEAYMAQLPVRSTTIVQVPAPAAAGPAI